MLTYHHALIYIFARRDEKRAAILQLEAGISCHLSRAVSNEDPLMATRYGSFMGGVVIENRGENSLTARHG